MSTLKRKSLSQTSQSSNSLLNHGFKRLKKTDYNDEDAENIRATNKGRAGRIARVILKNFMCHACLEVTFNSNTTIIVGRNGSGKSAILTALIVGLGGKARDTNRGTNMKSFIKNGQTSATVEITLTNTGPMAFEAKIFGPEITVIRTFSEANNCYKLKNAAGRIVSTAYGDVCKMIDALSIQVDNPVCLLNQNVARTFLNTNDPTKKYALFMKATNLENVKQQNELAKHSQHLTRKCFELKVKERNKLAAETKIALQKYQALQNIVEIEEKQKELQNKIAWAQVDVIENDLAEKLKQAEEIKGELENCRDLVRNKGTRKQNLEQNRQQIEQKLLEIKSEEENNQNMITQKRAELSKAKENVVKKKSDITSADNTVQRKLADLKIIEEAINNSSEHQQERLRLVQERDKQLAVYEEKRQELLKLIETTEHDANQTRNALKRKQLDKNNLNSELNETSQKIRQVQMKIRTMRSNESSSISVYGDKIQKIVRSIETHKEQFIKLPKGPIGSYIKLKDKKWALAVENFIGRATLGSFCVDNQTDAKLLNQIFIEVCGDKSRKPSIITSKFFNKVHNYLPNKVLAPKECLCAIDALIIKDPVIINCLIDQLAIENVLLIPTNEMARHLMSLKAHVPKNCRCSYTLYGDQFFPDPSYRCYSNKNKTPRFLQVSVSEVIRILQEELKNTENNESAINGQFQKVSEDLSKLSKDLQGYDNSINKYEYAKSQITKKIEDIQLQHVPPEQNLKVLAEEKIEIINIIDRKKKDIEKMKEEYNLLKVQMSEAETNYNKIKQISKDLEVRLNPLIDDLTNIDMNLKTLNSDTKYNIQKIKNYEEKYEKAQFNYEAKKKNLEERLKNIMNMGPRIKITKPVEEICQELNEINQQLEEAKASFGNQDLIAANYTRLQEKYDKAVEDLKKAKISLEIISQSVEKRLHEYSQLASYIGIRVREMFSGVLKLRRFTGTLEIDTVKESLEMVVYPQHSQAKGAGKTHILSGGERSYSTVAFLHSLWQVMEYPFYFLDEFDVFMDKINRRTVLDILIAHAVDHPDLQYVFLTPQDISEFVNNDKVTVIKMADPDRISISQA